MQIFVVSYVVRLLRHVCRLFGAVADFVGGLPSGGERLLWGAAATLARLAADDVAEGVLEALGAAVGREALLRPSPASGRRSP